MVFGGQAGGFFSDVWAFDVAGQAWQRLAADDAGPSRRYGHSAVYDAKRDRMVISHGFTNSGRFDDTWAFDLGTRQWRNLTPSGTKPLRRCLHHAALDPNRDQMFLYGGCASGFGPCPLDDLWSFDLGSNTWTQQSASPRPEGRDHYGMAFDVTRDRLVVFGGYGGGTRNDVWEWDPGAKAWSSVSLSTKPTPRSRHEAAAYAGNGILFFGGATDNGVSNELWRLSVVTTAKPAFTQDSVRSAFGREAAWIAPGEILSVYGTGLGGTVRFEGLPGEVYYASETQVNVRVPEALAGRTQASVVIEANGRVSEAVQVPVRKTHLSLFDGVVHTNGTLNGTTNRVAGGSIVLLFGTGQGLTKPALRVTVDGSPAEVLYGDAAPGFPGLLQVNVRVPAVPPRDTPVPVTVELGEDAVTVQLYLQ